MRTLSVSSTSAILVGAVLAGCTGVPLPFQTKAGATPETIHQTCQVPTIAPMGKTEEVQKRGGVVISVSTVPFTARLVERKAYRQLQTLLVRNGKHNYEVTTTPVLAPSPRQLRFKIRVLNNTDDVLRLAGTLVRFNLDGKDYALDAESSGMRSIVDGVLAPREQKEFDLVAAPADKLRQGANVSLRIYGVATGSAKEKGNYEWNYRVVSIREEAKDVAATVQTVALEPAEADRLQREQLAADVIEATL